MSWITATSRSVRVALARFRKRDDGNVALLFGITLLPIAGMVGAALDYNRAIELREFMHRENDVAALSIASAETPNADSVIAVLKARVGNHLGTGSTLITNVDVTDAWVGSSTYTVTLKANLATTLASLLPGSPKTIPISVTTAVKRKPAEWGWDRPAVTNLSYEAADYNRISVYCYDESKKNETNKGRRMETLTAMADNGGTNYANAKVPECGAGETLSYQLRNVRNSRTTPSNWDKATAEHYLYFTDTTIDPNSLNMQQNVTGGREASNGTITPVDVKISPIVETILCTTATDCKTKSQGGVLPNDNVGSHDPQTAVGACSKGKSMYFGWEDRPPSAGGSDKDFNDIRILVSCPSLRKLADKEIRIIR